MSRNRGCPIMVAAETDPRFRTLPSASRWLWISLLRAAQASSISVFRFGGEVPSHAELADFAQHRESELEAYLPGLLRMGLLVHEKDGALAAPFLRAALTRSEINRINGLKGGRPRKATIPPQPSQREMLMPLPSTLPAAKAEGLDPALAFGSVSPAIASCTTIESDSSSATVGLSETRRIGRAAMAEANLPPGSGHAGIVGKWLAAGATEELILSTIRARMEGGAKPNSLGYFAKAILEALEGRAEPSSWSVRGEAWNAAFDAWTHSGPWNERGPAPELTDFAQDGSRIAKCA